VFARHLIAQRRRDRRRVRAVGRDPAGQYAERQQRRQEAGVVFPSKECRIVAALIEAAQRQRPGQVAQEGRLAAAGVAEQRETLVVLNGFSPQERAK
jgi:hypothetical protein